MGHTSMSKAGLSDVNSQILSSKDATGGIILLGILICHEAQKEVWHC